MLLLCMNSMALVLVAVGRMGGCRILLLYLSSMAPILVVGVKLCWHCRRQHSGKLLLCLTSMVLVLVDIVRITRCCKQLWGLVSLSLIAMGLTCLAHIAKVLVLSGRPGWHTNQLLRLSSFTLMELLLVLTNTGMWLLLTDRFRRQHMRLRML